MAINTHDLAIFNDGTSFHNHPNGFLIIQRLKNLTFRNNHVNFQVMKDLSLMEKTNNSALIHLFLDMMEIFFYKPLFKKNDALTPSVQCTLPLATTCISLSFQINHAICSIS